MADIAIQDVSSEDAADNHELGHVVCERIVVVAHNADTGVVALDGVNGQVEEVGEQQRDEDANCAPEQNRRPERSREHDEKIGDLDCEARSADDANRGEVEDVFPWNDGIRQTPSFHEQEDEMDCSDGGA